MYIAIAIAHRQLKLWQSSFLYNHDIFYFFRCPPKAIGVCLKNPKLFPKNMLNTNLSFKNCYDINMRVYTSIFTKFWNLVFDLEIGYRGVFGHKKHKDRIKNCMIYSWGSMRRFFKNLSQNFKIGYVGVFRRQEHEYGHKNSLSILLRVCRPILPKLWGVEIEMQTLKSFFLRIFKAKFLTSGNSLTIFWGSGQIC